MRLAAVWLVTVLGTLALIAQAPIPGPLVGGAVGAMGATGPAGPAPCTTIYNIFFNSAASTPGCDGNFLYNTGILSLPSATGVYRISTDVGFSRSAAGQMALGNGTQGDISGFYLGRGLNLANGNAGIQFAFYNTGLSMSSALPFAWTSGNLSAGYDTGMSRDAAGIIDVGNGTATNTSGSLKLASVISAATKFTTSGCSVSATTGGATAGTYTSGTTGTCTVVITMNGATGLTAPNGWACTASDRTTAADVQQNTASSTTTATISGPTLSGDVISFQCLGY